MIEQNSANFDLMATMKAIFIIGFPTYLTYVTQAIMLMGLWVTVFPGDDMSAVYDSICVIDSSLLYSALLVFWITMGPSYIYVMRSVCMILFSKRVSYTQDMDNGNVYVLQLQIPMTKRLFIFVFVSLVELVSCCCIESSLFFKLNQSLSCCYFFLEIMKVLLLLTSAVGVGYLVSSDDIEDLITNSVSIVFIMQVREQNF